MPSYVVTGAGRGLGYAFVRRLSQQQGNTVIGLVRNASTAVQRAQQDRLDKVHFIEAHITDPVSLLKAATEVARITGGGLDVLINNAAYISAEGGYSTVIDPTPEQLEADLTQSFHVNVVGVAHTINTFLPLIRKGSQKKVISISTGMADADFVNDFGIAIAGPYAISKAALNLLVAKYHAALGKSEGILFLALSPGLVRTGEKDLTPEEQEGFKQMAAQFQTYAPHFTGPITPSESVEKQMAVIDRATVEAFGGQFVSHFGNKQWL